MPNFNDTIHSISPEKITEIQMQSLRLHKVLEHLNPEKEFHYNSFIKDQQLQSALPIIYYRSSSLCFAYVDIHWYDGYNYNEFRNPKGRGKYLAWDESDGDPEEFGRYYETPELMVEIEA